MKKLLLSTAIAIVSFHASALELKEALTYGYQNDEQLKIIRNSFLSEIEAFPSALSEFMPKVSASIETTDSRVKQFTERPNSIPANNVSVDKSIRARQSIFNGWSSVSKLKAAQATFKSSRSRYYSQEQEQILREINIYLTCVEYKEKYEIAKISVESNRTQLQAMQERFNLGESTETELASAQEALSSALAAAEEVSAAYEEIKAIFYQTFGVEAQNLSIPQAPTDLPESLQRLEDIAIRSNHDIIAAFSNSKAAKANEYAAKGALLPRADVTISESRTSYNPEQPLLNRVKAKSTSTIFSVTIPILEQGGAEYSNIRRSKYQARESRIRLEDTIKKTKAEVRTNWKKYDAAKLRIEAGTQAVKAAEIAYDGIVQEEALGSKTVVDVVKTEERLNNARAKLIEAKKELILAAYRIKSSMGSLTAKSLALNVRYFNPEREFKKTKAKIIGF